MKAVNAIIIGFSQSNHEDNIENAYFNTRGLITPRSDGFMAQNITFYNFDFTMTPLQSCSQCSNPKLWTNNPKTSVFSQIKFVNISNNYIFW